MVKYQLIMTSLAVFVILMSGCAPRTEDTSPVTIQSISLAIPYLQQGHLEQARLILNQALSIQPRAAAAWGTMGYLEEISGNLEIAAHHYRYAIQLAPQQGDGHNNYGVFLCRHGQPRAGIAELLIATQLPSYIHRANAYENAGRCALTIPDQAAAANYFKAAQRNNPKFSSCHRGEKGSCAESGNC